MQPRPEDGAKYAASGAGGMGYRGWGDPASLKLRRGKGAGWLPGFAGTRGLRVLPVLQGCICIPSGRALNL